MAALTPSRRMKENVDEDTCIDPGRHALCPGLALCRSASGTTASHHSCSAACPRRTGHHRSKVVGGACRYPDDCCHIRARGSWRRFLSHGLRNEISSSKEKKTARQRCRIVQSATTLRVREGNENGIYCQQQERARAGSDE